VVAVGVDHQRVQHLLHAGLHLLLQLLQLAGLQERGDVVVGMEALARRLDAFADPHRHGSSGVCLGCVHGVFGFHEHPKC
jgi:hypothetical protein